MKSVDVAVLGGAFDPPHLGHLIMAAGALQMAFCREVWLMPSPDRPDKQMRRALEMRRELLEAACRQLCPEFKSKIKVSLFEANLGVFRGSLFLMDSLAHAFPLLKFGFILGQDALEQTNSWNDPTTGELTGAEFLRRVPVISFSRSLKRAHLESSLSGEGHSATQRNGLVVAKENLNHLLVRVQSAFELQLNTGFDYSKLSSTRVREELAKGELDLDFLKQAVGNEVLEILLREFAAKK